MNFSPLFLNLPLPIVTHRLIMKPAHPDDTDMIYPAIVESYDTLKNWLPWARICPTAEENRATLTTFYADFIQRKRFVLAMFHNEQFIGLCGFNDFHWSIPSGSIGYWTRLSESGKGYTTEAVQAIAQYGFEHLRLKRITITCHDENYASQKVAQKAGFELEVRARGLIEHPLDSDLCWAQRYVKFFDT